MSTTANERYETITKIKMMSGCLPPHISGCLPPQHEEYDDAGDDDDDGVMNIFVCVLTIPQLLEGAQG